MLYSNPDLEKIGGYMELAEIKDLVLDYFNDEFDHSLINDQLNDPFIHISLINSSSINPHRDSFGFYLIDPGSSAVHTEHTTAIMAAALALEAKYLVEKPSRGSPVEDEMGCSKGITAGKNKILIITAISNLEDASFVCRSVINKLQIFLNKPR
jgi:hypothetical protein